MKPFPPMFLLPGHGYTITDRFWWLFTGSFKICLLPPPKKRKIPQTNNPFRFSFKPTSSAKLNCKFPYNCSLGNFQCFWMGQKSAQMASYLLYFGIWATRNRKKHRFPWSFYHHFSWSCTGLSTWFWGDTETWPCCCERPVSFWSWAPPLRGVTAMVGVEVCP